MARKIFKRLKRNYPLILSLKNSSPLQRKFLLKKANPDLIDTISDICYNIVKGNILIPEDKRKILIKHKKAIRRLADKKVKRATKRTQLIQQGGFLPALLPVLSIAASLLSGLISK